MENFKAIWNIIQTILLLVAGAAALTLSMLDGRVENIKLAVQILGAVCVVFGLTPMVIEYVKANWPKGKK